MRKSTEIAKEDRMDLFFSPLACSMSARIALAEAGAAANLIEVDPDTKRVLATGEDYRAIHPLGYVPALRLDDGTVLTENAAILQFIADEYPAAGLAPPASDRLARAKLRQWLSFIGTELHKALMTPLLGRETPPEVKAWTARKYASRRPVQYGREIAVGDAEAVEQEFPALQLVVEIGEARRRRKSTSPPIRTSRPISSACASARASPRRWRPRFRCSARKSRDGRRPDAPPPFGLSPAARGPRPSVSSHHTFGSFLKRAASVPSRRGADQRQALILN